jgi:glucose-6-phosphate dehydrogenase assembly protein OpcA
MLPANSAGLRAQCGQEGLPQETFGPARDTRFAMPELAAAAIAKELADLWDSLPGVVRACSLTLLVITDERDDAAAIARTLAGLMPAHPHRAILVRVRAGGESVLEHRVTAQCWMPYGGREQVCCELVEFTAGEPNLRQLSPVLAALAAPDLPVVTWHRGARPPDALGVRADKRIVDSSAFPDAAAALVMLAGEGPTVADLAWSRITCWREIVAQAFESTVCRELLARIETVRVGYSGGRVPPEAFYLAGWVAGTLGLWPEVRFERAEGAGRVEALALEAGGAGVTFTRHDAAVLIRSGALQNCAACPDRSEAELLSAELGAPARDPVFLNSLRAAAKLARGGR